MKNVNIILVLLGIVAVFVLGVILLELRSVLLPFTVALLFSFIFRPVVVFLKSKKIPMAVSLMAVLLSLALVLFLVGLTVYSSARSFTDAFSRYEVQTRTMTFDQYEAWIDRIAAEGDAARVDSARRSVVRVDSARQSVVRVDSVNQYQQRINAIVESAKGGLTRLAEPLGVNVDEFDFGDLFQISSVTSLVSSGVGSFFNFVGNTFLVILFMLFMLAGSGDFDVKIKRAYPEDVARRIAGVTHNISRQVRQYLAAKTMVSAITGFLIFLVLFILGVDFAVFWGFLAFLLNFIPNIGSLVAVIFPFLLSLLQFDTLTIPILAFILMQVVQTMMGNVVDPKLMAFSLNLSPLLVLVSLIFWGWLWGIIGMILAVPLTATIKIFFENVEPLRPVAVLMGGLSTPREESKTPEETVETVEASA